MRKHLEKSQQDCHQSEMLAADEERRARNFIIEAAAAQEDRWAHLTAQQMLTVSADLLDVIMDADHFSGDNLLKIDMSSAKANFKASDKATAGNSNHVRSTHSYMRVPLGVLMYYIISA